MNENYFLLAALRRKSDSPKEPDPCGSDSEVTVPRVLASPSSRLLHQACERVDPGWFWLEVLREQKTRSNLDLLTLKKEAHNNYNWKLARGRGLIDIAMCV